MHDLAGDAERLQVFSIVGVWCSVWNIGDGLGRLSDRNVLVAVSRNANRHSNISVGTTQRSIAAMASAWLLRKVRHVCEGGCEYVHAMRERDATLA